MFDCGTSPLSSQKSLGCSAVIQPMGGGGSRPGDPSITTAENDFPAPQHTGNSCNVQINAPCNQKSIDSHYRFSDGNAFSAVFLEGAQSRRTAGKACGAI